MTTPQKAPRILTPATELVSVDALHEHPRNARDGDIGAISESLDSSGFFGALVVQRSTGYILVGNHRYRAAVQKGMTALPVMYADVDDTQAIKIMLADNRANDRASYRDDVLGDLLRELAETDNLYGTAFDKEDVDDLLAILANKPLPVPDEKQGRTEAVDLSQEMAHTCPRCGFEFNDKPNAAAS